MPTSSPRLARRPASLACSLLVLPLAAWAGHPLQTDDAGVLAPSECELELVAERLSAPGTAAEGQGLGAGCGVGGRSQVGLSFATAREGGTRVDAWALGGKTGLWRAGDADDAAALSMSWELAWAKGGGSGWERAATGLNLIYSAPAGDALTWHANLGHGRDHLGGTSSTGWGLAVEHAGYALGALTVAPMGELVGDDREAPWWNLGLRATVVAERLWLSLSYGRQVDGRRASLASVGLKLAF